MPIGSTETISGTKLSSFAVTAPEDSATTFRPPYSSAPPGSVTTAPFSSFTATNIYSITALEPEISLSPYVSGVVNDRLAAAAPAETPSSHSVSPANL